jgi:hypothetical protein
MTDAGDRAGEGDHMSSRFGRIVQSSDARLPYKAILTHDECAETECSFATMREAEAFIAGTRLGPGLEAPSGIGTDQNNKDGGFGDDERKTGEVSTENWAEERERLVRLLAAIESGAITHVDEEDLLQLQATNPRNIAALKQRLEDLNRRLGENDPN